MRYLNVLVLVITAIFNHSVIAKESVDSELFREVMKMDTMLFEEGFNRCELNVLENIVSEELEFYHDEGGIQDKKMFLDSIKRNICSSPEKKPIRRLVKEGTEIHRLKSNGEMYGVLQRGVHEFFIKEPNIELYRTNIAKFTHLWIKKDGLWKLKRVLSYDHKEPPEYFKSTELDKKFNAKSPMRAFDKDGYIEEILVKHNIPVLSVGVINNGQIQQIRTFGNPKLRSVSSYKNIHKVASLTKPVAAMVALKVADKGLIDLDEEVFSYFMDKDIVKDPRSKKITFRHLLSHQSGLPNWRYLTSVKRLKLDFEPGSKYQYSGEGYELMRKAIEAKLNKPFEEIAEQYLFNPLGMTNTAFYWNDSINDNQYAQEHDEQGKPIAFDKYYSVNAAANLLTTIGDYGGFMVHVLDDSSLSKELYENMLTSQIVISEKKSFGLGWELHTNLDEQYGLGNYAIQHTGGDYGTKTLAIMFPEARKGLVVFTNSENGMVVWEKLLSEYYGQAGKDIVKRNLL